MSTTSNLALNKPDYNSQTPTWDQPLNNNATILDQMFGNTTSVSVNTGSSTTYTNISAPSSAGAGGTSQAMRFILTGALAANQNVLLPQAIQGMWCVTNATTGAYTVTLGSNNGSNAASGATVSVPQGYSVIVYCAYNSTTSQYDVAFADSGILQGGILPTLNVTGNTTLGSTGSNTTTINGKLTLASTTTQLSALLNNISETVTIVGSGTSGTINYYITSQSVLYYTSNSTANFTLNFAASSGTSLNLALSVGQSVTVAFLNTNGSTAYYNNAITIDGASVTPKWINGATPSSGYTNSIDTYTYTIIKTASATYTVLATLAKFA
jgi:hypothetical protein